MILQPIRVGRRRASLLTASTPIPELSGTEWDDEFIFAQTSCTLGVGAAPACAAPGGLVSGSSAASPKFGPMWAYGSAPCSSVMSNTRAEREDAAKEALDASIAATIESVFWTGEITMLDNAGVATKYPATVSDNGANVAMPSLSSTARILTGVGSLLTGMEGLEREAREVCGLKGPLTYHVPSWGRSRFNAFQLGLERVGDRYVYGDNTIVFGEGYGSKIGAVTAPAAQMWVALTGPVEVSVNSNVLVWPRETSTDAARQNIDPVWAQRQFAYRFETCCVLAALVEAC